MTTTRRLYLDCDGVLADFDASFLFRFGVTPLERESGVGSQAFWEGLQRCTPPFFLSLPIMPDAYRMFEEVAHLRPIILTGCPQGGWAEPQKLAWAAQHFPGTPMITCMARDKARYCQPGDVLVDDRDKYRDRWEAAGGIFVHHTSVETTLDELALLGMTRGTASRANTRDADVKTLVDFLLGWWPGLEDGIHWGDGDLTQHEVHRAATRLREATHG